MSAAFSSSSRCGTCDHPAWMNHLNCFDSGRSGVRNPVTTFDMPWSGVKVMSVMPFVVAVR